MQQHRDEMKAIKGLMKVPEALQKLGYTSLRASQTPCINRILGGEDTFCILPTSGGKTLIGIVPTIVNEWRTIIFSPLIALMKDQVDGLLRRNVRAGALNSSQSDAENWAELKDWTEGITQVLYVAPERINQPQFRQAMMQVPPDFVIVDEAHVMSKDSATFRPAYMECGTFIQDFKPQQVLALTATATKDIVDDVKRILGLPDMAIERHYTPRTNLHMSSSNCRDMEEVKWETLEKVRSIKGSVIVYCATVKNVIVIADFLRQCGESVTFYHGQIPSPAVKSANQDDFMFGRARIMVATNAFGMGIDKADIEGIIHVDPPGSVENIAQETGRAARDGRDAICHMFVHPAGERLQGFFWNMENPTAKALKDVMQVLKRFANTSNEVYMTNEEILKYVQDESAEGAMAYLTSMGVIDRIKPTARIATVTCTAGDKGVESLSPKLRSLYEFVEKGGIPSGHSASGNITYKIDLNYLADKLGILPGSVATNLKKLDKEGYISYTPPFNGKITKILRELTDEDTSAATKRRSAEWEKICSARAYARTPNELKQQFITDYFSKPL